MATITATKAGNWSDTSVWDLGRIPAAGDAVALAGYVIVWDAGVTRIPASGTLLSISSPSTAGQITLDLSNAAFNSGAALYVTTITAGTLDTVGTLRITGTTSNVLTITCGTGVGEGIIGGGGLNDHTIVHAGTGTINVTGNIIGGTGGAARGLSNTSTGAVNVTGNISGNTLWSSMGFVNSLTGAVSVSGNITGGSGNSAFGFYNTVNAQVTLSSTTKLINGAGGVAYGGYPPKWQPTAATYMYWYTGASFGQAPDTEFVRNLTAAEIKENVVSGSVTGTLVGLSSDIIAIDEINGVSLRKIA